MIKGRPKFPWKVIFLAPEGPLPEEKYTSEANAYRAVNLKRELVREESSAVTRAVVYQWNRSTGRWDTFDKHDLVDEAKTLPRNRGLSAPPSIPAEVEVSGEAAIPDEVEVEVPAQRPVKKVRRTRKAT